VILLPVTAPPTLLQRLRDSPELISVELRPPRADLGRRESMDVWIDMYHSVQRVARQDRVVFLTDNAVGVAEEENLQHLTANLGADVPPEQLVPFLTCKHTLDYCLLYARRAADRGIQALTVLGGDPGVGPPRCVPLSRDLRALIRKEVPALALGGWANPHRRAEEQSGFVAAPDFEADFYLTQVVSHHHLREVEAFVEAVDRRGVTLPGIFGVFYYRSANPSTLARLGDFLPVPAEALTREFGSGASAEEICARTIRGLREAGAGRIYLSNLGTRGVERRLERILAMV